MYPDELDISDGVMHENGGATFSSLIKNHDLIEEAVYKKSPEHSAMDWSIFQELHKIAKSEYAKQRKLMFPHQLIFQQVMENFQKNYESVLSEQAKSH